MVHIPCVMLAGVSMRRIAIALALLVPVACANRAKRSIDLYDSGDYAGAVRAADEGLASHPDDDNLWAMKVRASLALGDADGIAKAYEQYVAHRGGDDKALLRDLSTATLGAALASPSAKMKVAAIEAIEHIEIHSLTDQVAERMNDDDDRVAAAAAVAVLRGMPGAPQVADDMMNSTNADARRIAVEGIGRKVGKLALADLEKAAKDSDARVRRAAIRWLGMLKDADAVELLMRHLKDPDDSVRAASATALARIGIGNLAGLGKQVLVDRSLAVRLAAVELFAAAKADAELVALTDDADPMVATQAAIAVKTTHPELVTKAMMRAIAAPEWTIRAGAANLMMMALGKEDAHAKAQTLASDPEVGVRLAAARVLAQTGDKEGAKRVLSAAISDADFGVQAAADLADLGDAAGMQALSSYVRDPKRTPAQRAAAASAHRSAHHVTGGLVAALADGDGFVRVEAAAAIGMLAKQR
ncbi:MAG TPA: HEAT repeat domain-containing protein [Kofleriaceae bacterium]